MGLKEIFNFVARRCARRTPGQAAAFQSRNRSPETLALHQIVRLKIADGKTGMEQVSATSCINDLLDRKSRTLHKIPAVKAH